MDIMVKAVAWLITKMKELDDGTCPHEEDGMCGYCELEARW